MAISILVNDEFYLDLQKEFVGLNYQIFDLSNIETRTGTFSNDFEIPDTAHNREALGFGTIRNISTSNFNEKIPAKVYDNNIMISKGFIQVNKNINENIDITFYGDNVDVFELLKGKKLRETGENLTDLQHAYSAANVTGSFTNSSGYIYLPIDYGLFTDRASMTIASGEIYPAIFLPDIVTAMFKGIGYKVTGTLLNRALFKKSVVAFTNEQFGYSQEFVDSKAFYAKGDDTFSIGAGQTVQYDFTATVDNFQGVNYGNSLFNLTTDRYTVDGDYQIRISASYNHARFTGLNPATQLPHITVKKNGVAVIGPSAGGLGFYPSATTFATVTSGDYFEAYVTNNVGYTILMPTLTLNGNVSREFVANSIIYPETIIPDITQTDFLKWILFRFCGVMTVDEFSKTVYLNQFSDLKNNNVDDWSSKVDLSKRIETDYSSLVGNYAKRNIAEYQVDDKDIYQTTYNSNNELNFGNGMFELNNDFVENENTIYEAPFSGTFLVSSFDTNELIIPYIPRHLPNEDTINIPGPRVLTVYGNLSINQFSSASSMSVLGTSVDSIPFSYFYKSTLGFEVDDFKESLAFGSQNIFAPNDLGAFDSDYLDIIRILNDPNVEIAYIKLNQIDIVNLNHLKKKYFERFGGYFYLNKIEDYDGSGDSVKCELIKL